MAAPLVGREEDVVGDHVELLLASPCTLLASALPSTSAERAVRDRARDRLAGGRDRVQHAVEIAARFRMAAPRLDQEFGERGLVGQKHAGPPQRLVCDGEAMPLAQARESTNGAPGVPFGSGCSGSPRCGSVTNVGGSDSASEYQVGVATTARPARFGAADAVRRILERKTLVRVEAELAQRFDDRRRARASGA